MAPNDSKPTETKAAGAPDRLEGGSAAPAKGAMTAARAARLVGGTVRIPVIDKKTGKPVVRKGVYATAEESLAAEHVTGFRVAGDCVVVTTVDGRKLEGALK